MKKMLILLFAVILLAGCSRKTPSDTPETPDVDATPDSEWAWLFEEPTGPDATKATLELSERSLTESLEFFFLMNDDDSGAAYLDSIARVRSFSVTSFSKDDEAVTAEVTISIPDIYTVVKGMDLSGYATAEETDAALCSAIQAAPTQDRQVTIEFTAGSNRWEPVMDEEAADAFYGGLMTYLEETMEGAE